MKHLLFIFISLISSFGISQSHLDSLYQTWSDSTNEPLVRLSALDDFIWDGFLFTEPDSAYALAKIELAFTQALLKDNKTYHEKLIKYTAIANNTMGASRYLKGEYEAAVQYYEEYYSISEEIGDETGMASALNNIANIYSYKGDIINSIKYYTRSLKLAEKVQDSSHIANALDNIGILNVEIKEYDEALVYHEKSYLIRKLTNQKNDVGKSLGNIANLYFYKKDYVKSKEYNLKSIAIFKETKNPYGLVESYILMGSLYELQNQIDSAYLYFFAVRDTSKRTNNDLGYVAALRSIASLNLKEKNYSDALVVSVEGLRLAQKLNVPKEIKDLAKIAYECYRKLGNTNLALDMFEIHIAAKDSLLNESNQKEIFRQEYKISYERKSASDSIIHIEQQKVNEAIIDKERAEKKNQKLILFFVIGLFILATVFGMLIFKRFKVSKKQNIIIKKQKEDVELAHYELEEKNQEIMDSITYAKRIQSAILPPKKLVKQYLEESFILYKPKDIVAGDFYWMSTSQSVGSTREPNSDEKLNSIRATSTMASSLPERTEERILFAAADCTGHGVPGAMVSVVCNNALNRSVKEYGLTDPGEILNKTREIVIQEFEKSDEEVKDGMDIALVSLSVSRSLKSIPTSRRDGAERAGSSSSKLQYSGAHNPLWIIRKGATEIEEIKANKQPIGKFIDPKPYTTHTVELNQGDTIYIFSDGYVDQFGGEKGKKFKAKAFRALLLSIQDKDMEEQRKILDESFESWRGELEQIDDVCIIGVRC